MARPSKTAHPRSRTASGFRLPEFPTPARPPASSALRVGSRLVSMSQIRLRTARRRASGAGARQTDITKGENDDRNGRHSRTTRFRAAIDSDRRPVPERQDQPARGPARARRRRGAAGLGARAHQHRRFQPRGARPRDERRAEHRACRLHGRPDDVRRLSRIGRVHARHALGAAGLRRRGGGLRSRSAQDPGFAGHPARARGDAGPAIPVPEQDRSGQRRGARRAGADPAGLAHAAAAAADSALGERRRHRLRRSGAPARLRLPRVRALGGHRNAGGSRARREAGALFDAGAARGLRRRADGAIAQRPRAAARPDIRRPRARIARRPHRPAVDRFGDRRPRGDPPA